MSPAEARALAERLTRRCFAQDGITNVECQARREGAAAALRALADRVEELERDLETQVQISDAVAKDYDERWRAAEERAARLQAERDMWHTKAHPPIGHNDGPCCEVCELDAQLAAAEAQRDRLTEALDWIRRFAEAHHAQQEAHVLLHGLTVDIVDVAERALATDEEKKP